ncbi:MAG: terminase small subunit [Verrucomicrobiia bacterium]
MGTAKKTTVKHGKPEEKLTPKQRTALKVYAETGNKTESARAAGYSDPNANATRVFEPPAMQTAVVGIFKQLGITEMELLHPIKLALNAKRKEKVVETRKVKDGLFEMERPVEVTKGVPDIELRLQGTALGTKLLRMGEGDPEYGRRCSRLERKQ